MPQLEPAQLATFQSLLDLAAAGPLSRGRALIAKRVVTLTSVTGDTVTAQVRGTHTYQVSLDATTRTHQCNCPAAADGSFCKHCVAVVHELARSPDGSPDEQNATPSNRDRIATYLEARSVPELVDLLLEQADHDERLFSGLLARSMADAGEHIDVREWKKRVTKAQTSHH